VAFIDVVTVECGSWLIRRSRVLQEAVMLSIIPVSPRLAPRLRVCHSGQRHLPVGQLRAVVENNTNSTLRNVANLETRKLFGIPAGHGHAALADCRVISSTMPMRWKELPAARGRCGSGAAESLEGLVAAPALFESARSSSPLKPLSTAS